MACEPPRQELNGNDRHRRQEAAIGRSGHDRLRAVETTLLLRHDEDSSAAPNKIRREAQVEPERLRLGGDEYRSEVRARQLEGAVPELSDLQRLGGHPRRLLQEECSGFGRGSRRPSPQNEGHTAIGVPADELAGAVVRFRKQALGGCGRTNRRAACLVRGRARGGTRDDASEGGQKDEGGPESHGRWAYLLADGGVERDIGAARDRVLEPIRHRGDDRARALRAGLDEKPDDLGALPRLADHDKERTGIEERPAEVHELGGADELSRDSLRRERVDHRIARVVRGAHPREQESPG